MARLNLSDYTSGGGSPMGAPMGLLDDVFAGGGLRMIDRNDPGNMMGSRAPLTKAGVEGLGINPWEDVWGAQGRVKDPMLLMQYLNAANVMNLDANPWIRAKEGTSPGAYSQYSGGFGDVSYDPYMQTGYDTGNWEDALGAWLYNQSYKGHDAGEGWGGRDKSGDVRGAYYDPSLLRYTDSSQFEGMRAADMDEWARSQGAASLWDLVSKPTALIEEEARWRNDPSLWFNPGAPGMPGRFLGTQGLGLGDLAVDRMDALGSGLEGYAGRQDYLRDMGPEMFMANMLRQDPGMARTGLGQYHGAVTPMSSQASRAMGAFAPQGANYDYLMQTAMQPYLMQQQLQNYFSGI